MKQLYTAAVHVTGGREGRVRAADGQFDLPMSMPKALGGTGQGANPEQLFAAGFAACFASSIQFAAQQQKVEHGPVRVDAEATLLLRDGGTYGLAMRLTVTLPDVAPEARAAILAEAERICAYSNATRGNVVLTVV